MQSIDEEYASITDYNNTVWRVIDVHLIPDPTKLSIAEGDPNQYSFLNDSNTY